MASEQPSIQQDLVVKGESVERIYGNYINQKYIVDRRYQRKLVWTLDEKRRFIDSVRKGYPVPIILLAESKEDERNNLEIIDGMQRLNSLMSFIENEYAVDGEFFNLEAMAVSKQLLDTGKLVQRKPTMDREDCVKIVSYTVPISVYESAKESEVDEVFRRINSGGRQLSKQELRTAGATGFFAQVVRILASKIRGDSSSGDELLLNDMKKISITNGKQTYEVDAEDVNKSNLAYGIDVDSLFWVKHKVLTKEQVRESKDEEIIADMLAYTLLSTRPPSRSEFLNDYFGFSNSEAAIARHNEIEIAVQKHTQETVIIDFQRVFDELSLVLDASGKTFTQLLLGGKITRAPRYFQVVFLAFHKLIISDRKEIVNYKELADLLAGSGKSIHIAEGGKWNGKDRATEVKKAAADYEEAFKQVSTYDPSKEKWIIRLENLMNQSALEQNAYDFKQGFLRLDKKAVKFDDAAFEKILKTLVGIANIRKGTTGYVVVGIADTKATAVRVKTVFGADARRHESFYVTGLEHEATAMGKKLDELYQTIVDRVKTSKISEPLRSFVARHIIPVKYYEKEIFVFESTAQEDPSDYDGTFYIRHGNQLDAEAVKPIDIIKLVKRFSSGL